jgi:hypothetical protein
VSFLFRRRDPWWEDGPDARRRRRRQQITAALAFALSCSAVAGTAAAWALELGFGRLVGLG